MGFSARTVPLAASAKQAVTTVFPTPVSVPVMNQRVMGAHVNPHG